MEPRELQIGDVVQLSPEKEGHAFRGCLMMVTEPKSFGAQGFIAMPESRDKMPGQAFYRVLWEDMEYIGKATWVPSTEPDL